MADRKKSRRAGVPASSDTHPRDVENILRILDSMGAETGSPRVVSQLLEFVQRYSSEVLIKANILKQHREQFGVGEFRKQKGDLTAADVATALQLVEKNKFQGTPSVAYLRQAAHERFANQRGDGAPTTQLARRKAANKQKSDAANTEMSFGDLHDCPSGLLLRPRKRPAPAAVEDGHADDAAGLDSAGIPGLGSSRASRSGSMDSSGGGRSRSTSIGSSSGGGGGGVSLFSGSTPQPGQVASGAGSARTGPVSFPLRAQALGEKKRPPSVFEKSPPK